MKNIQHYLIALIALISFPIYIITVTYIADHLKHGSIYYDMMNRHSTMAIAILWVAYDVFAIVVCRRYTQTSIPYKLSIVGLIAMIVLTAAFFYVLYKAWGI